MKRFLRFFGVFGVQCIGYAVGTIGAAALIIGVITAVSWLAGLGLIVGLSGAFVTTKGEELET